MEEGLKALLLEDSSTNEVLRNVANAVSVLYHDSNDDQKTLEPLRLQDAKLVVESVATKLPELGASPEQRETIDDFVQMIQNAA
mmetsp:Transcript_45610/g.110500  ORF Transcript_45610/g.110500 Transcript_45610/m.110500 type:complete len:84 (+) Transcript_45610:1080-1331(+)